MRRILPPRGGNLAGVSGLLRLTAASNQPAGSISLGTEASFYWVPEMLDGGQDHSRLENSITISFTPWRYIEAALSARVVSDSSSGGALGDERQVAVGDPRLVLKGGGEVTRGISLGGLVDLRFFAGAGYFEEAAAATSVLFSVLASWWGGERLPIEVHLNFGFLYDGVGNLVEDPSLLTESQRQAIGISSFHRLVTRVGLSYVTRCVGPFLEFSLENLVGSEAPGFSFHPGYASAGLRAWPTASKSMQILAAVDVGFSGVANGTALAIAPGLYTPVIPRWNVLLSLAYRFNVFSQPSKAPRRGRMSVSVAGTPAEVPEGQSCVIQGQVLDSATGEPLAGARVLVEGEMASSSVSQPGERPLPHLPPDAGGARAPGRGGWLQGQAG